MVRFITDGRKVDASSDKGLLVIGAGLPRAATSSMQAAFEQLGITPCMHMANIIPHPDREMVLLHAIQEKDTASRQKLLRKLVDGHLAICDLPVVFFTPDLMDMYPEAKIVLNQRPSAQLWATSAYESLGFFFTPWFKWAGLLWTTDRLWYRLNMECTRWCKEKYGVENVFSPEMYEKHYQTVRDTAKMRGREILEFRAEDGWKPLCQFLEKPVPGTPFPKLDEKRAFAIIKTIIILRGLAVWAALGTSVWMSWRFVPLLLKQME